VLELSRFSELSRRAERPGARASSMSETSPSATGETMAVTPNSGELREYLSSWASGPVVPLSELVSTTS
jgi:hypothetical protein